MHVLDRRPWPQFSSARLPVAIATTTTKLIYSKPLVTRIHCKLFREQQHLYVGAHTTANSILCKLGPQAVVNHSLAWCHLSGACA